jgi:DtxR family Mn-dependent transcriptional regulator
MTVIQQQSLSDTNLRKPVIVSSVSNQTPQMLEMLKHYHIVLGSSITVHKKFEFDGSLEIKVMKHSNCIISEQVAKNVFVHYDQ